MDSSVATRLLRAVLAKSFVEILLVCLVATLAAFSNFSPMLRGTIDAANQSRIAGWVYDPNSRAETVEVQLFIDGKFITSQMAGLKRDDLMRAGVAGEGAHGFNFSIGALNLSPGSHLAQVFAVRDANGPNKVLASITKAPRAFNIPLTKQR